MKIARDARRGALAAAALASAVALIGSPTTASSSPAVAQSAGFVQQPEPTNSAAAAESPLAIALASTDDLTDAGIQAALEAGGATDVHIQKDPTDGTALDNGTITSVQLGGGGLPQDLFTVRGTWADYVQNGKVYVDFYGRWNYNDEYIGSGNPYDAAGIIVGGFNKECWTNVSTGLKTQSNDGTQTGLANKKSSGHQKTIFNVFDDTKAFQLQTDMGFAWIEMRRDTLSCDARKIGRFYHEHNQNGDGGWTASLNVGNFTLTYDEAPKALQKGTKVKYYDKY